MKSLAFKTILILLFTISYHCKTEESQNDTSYEVTEQENESYMDENEEIQIDTSGIKQKRFKKETLERFKVNGKDMSLNFFNIKNEHLKLRIPIPNNRLEIKEVYNISSNIGKKLNAIVVILDGNGGRGTNRRVTHFIDCDIPFSKLDRPLDTTRLREDNKLIVYVLHDNEPENCALDLLRSCVQGFQDYQDVRCDIKVCETSLLDKDDKYVPAENDGDVIGGNG